ncbi:MAG: SEC-C metal-binding domain-containing protein [Bacilli bacterium]|nr:SEC-C metal-binding domain-containing protein [Bacilli bacterium]
MNQSFTIEYLKGLTNRLLTPVLVLDNSNISKIKLIRLKSKDEFLHNAIWDTGATNTVISSKLVKTLQLFPVSVTKVSNTTGTYNANQYLVDIILPNNVHVRDILVTEGFLPNCDLLIGMDIITKGDFCVTNMNRKTMFSFHMPSQHSFDFVKTKNVPIVMAQKISRNAPCPCNSGKKYKNCCGKSI